MEKALVLGRTGKIGRALERYWSAHAPGVSPAWMGRSEAEGVVPAARAVLALWGKTAGDAETLAQNATLAERAAALAAEAGADRVIHLSSAAVYGGAGPYREEDAPAPRNAYGLAKCEMEARIARLGGGARHCILRLANVAGADSLFRALEAQGEIVLDRFEDGGGPERSYIAIPELAQVFETLLGCEALRLPQVLNVAAPAPVAMEEIARAAGRRIVWQAAGAAAVQRVVLDTARLESLVSFGPQAGTASHLVESWQRYGAGA